MSWGLRAGMLMIAVWASAFGSGLAIADAPALPVYSGAMSFPAIQGSLDAEDYSWEVILGEGQVLESVDPQHAVVRNEDETPATLIYAEPAHDVEGATVPTSLAVSAGNVITLMVHHRAGNVAAGGAPFAYPVTAGEGWEGGHEPVIIIGPKDEQELREERERIAREKQEALEREWEIGRSAAASCLVPRLKGRSLKASQRLLRRAKCLVGNVRKLEGATARDGKVVKQNPKPGSSLELWTGVNLTLGR